MNQDLIAVIWLTALVLTIATSLIGPRTWWAFCSGAMVVASLVLICEILQ